MPPGVDSAGCARVPHRTSLWPASQSDGTAHRRTRSVAATNVAMRFWHSKDKLPHDVIHFKIVVEILSLHLSRVRVGSEASRRAVLLGSLLQPQRRRAQAAALHAHSMTMRCSDGRAMW